MTPELFIVNEIDCPCEAMIAYKRKDGKLNYISPEKCMRQFDGMPITRAVPLQDFGISFTLQAGTLTGKLDHESVATYRGNGGRRSWQGSHEFSISAQLTE